MTDAAPKRLEVKQLFSSPVFSTSTPTPRPYFTIEPIPSPASTVASLTRELEDTLQTLDLHTAMQGQYVVKPQVITKSDGMFKSSNTEGKKFNYFDICRPKCHFFYKIK